MKADIATFPRRFIPSLLACFMIAAPLPLRADWKWDNDVVEAISTPEEYKAVFTFQNTGTEPLTAEAINSCCSCTVFSFKATSVTPGKSGTLSIIIDRAKSSTSKATFDFIVLGAGATATKLQVIAK